MEKSEIHGKKLNQKEANDLKQCHIKSFDGTLVSIHDAIITLNKSLKDIPVPFKDDIKLFVSQNKDMVCAIIDVLFSKNYNFEQGLYHACQLIHNESNIIFSELKEVMRKEYKKKKLTRLDAQLNDLKIHIKMASQYESFTLLQVGKDNILWSDNVASAYRSLITAKYRNICAMLKERTEVDNAIKKFVMNLVYRKKLWPDKMMTSEILLRKSFEYLKIRPEITKKFMKSDPRVKYLSNSFFRSKMDCEGCLFTSIRFRDLINHMGCAKHLEKVRNYKSGEIPYNILCQACQSSFTDQNDLRQHCQSKIHTDKVSKLLHKSRQEKASRLRTYLNQLKPKENKAHIESQKQSKDNISSPSKNSDPHNAQSNERSMEQESIPISTAMPEVKNSQQKEPTQPSIPKPVVKNSQQKEPTQPSTANHVANNSLQNGKKKKRKRKSNKRRHPGNYFNIRYNVEPPWPSYVGFTCKRSRVDYSDIINEYASVGGVASQPSNNNVVVPEDVEPRDGSDNGSTFTGITDEQFGDLEREIAEMERRQHDSERLDQKSNRETLEQDYGELKFSVIIDENNAESGFLVTISVQGYVFEGTANSQEEALAEASYRALLLAPYLFEKRSDRNARNGRN